MRLSLPITAISLTVFGASTALADPHRQRPTPSEFRSWEAYGPSYGWDCVVVAKGGGQLWRQMGTGAAGRLPRGKPFVPKTAATDRRGRIWYRVDFIYRSPLKGWIAATDVGCNPEHFD